MQWKQYITYRHDKALKAIMKYNYWRADERLLKIFVNELRKK